MIPNTHTQGLCGSGWECTSVDSSILCFMLPHAVDWVAVFQTMSFRPQEPEELTERPWQLSRDDRSSGAAGLGWGSWVQHAGCAALTQQRYRSS